MFKIFCLYATAAANVEASLTPNHFATCDTTKSMYHETCCGAEPSVPLIDKTFLHLDNWVSAATDGTLVELQAYDLFSLKDQGKHSEAKVVAAFRQTFGRNPTADEHNFYHEMLDSGTLNEFELDATLTQTDEFMSVIAGKAVEWKESGALQTKNVFVTGASSGIGFATMVAMAWAGANVTGCARERFYYDEHLKSARMNVSDRERYPVYFGPVNVPEHVLDRMEFVTCDVRNAANITKVVQDAAGEKQQIDVVVAAAGSYVNKKSTMIAPSTPVLQDLCHARRTPQNCSENDMMTNYYGVINTYNALYVPKYLNTTTFIIIASIAGFDSYVPGNEYGVSKAALRSLTSKLPGVYDRTPGYTKLNVRLISPDFVATDMVTMNVVCGISDVVPSDQYPTGNALYNKLDRTATLNSYWNLKTANTSIPPYGDPYNLQGALGCAAGSRKVAMFAAATAFVLATEPESANEFVLTNRAADWIYNSVPNYKLYDKFLRQGKASNTLLYAYFGMSSTKPYAAYPDESSSAWGTVVFPALQNKFNVIEGLNTHGMKAA